MKSQDDGPTDHSIAGTSLASIADRLAADRSLTTSGEGVTSSGADDSAVVVVDARQRRWILLAACLGLMAVMMSTSGLNVALNDLAADIDASQTQLLWIVNAYMIAMAALLLPLGAIGDRVGRKPMFVVGLVLFLAATLVSAFMTSATMLIALRAVTGVGGALIMPTTLSVLTSSFPASERPRAVALWTATAGVGSMASMIGSALIVDAASWRWVYGIPLAVGVLALIATVIAVPNSRDHVGGRFDIVGSVLSAVAFGGTVMGVELGPKEGWTSPLTLLGLVVGGLGLVAFALWELRERIPLLDVRVFRSQTLSMSTLALIAMFAVQATAFLVLIQYEQNVLDYSALKSALALFPMMLVSFPASIVAGRVIKRSGLRSTLLMGMFISVAGTIWLATAVSADSGYAVLVVGLILQATGMGVAMTPGTTGITSSLPRENQGVASALNDIVRTLGAGVGIALIGSLMSSIYSNEVSEATDGLSPELASRVEGGIAGATANQARLGSQGDAVMDAAKSAFVDGWRTGMWVGAAVLGVAVLYVVLFGGDGTDGLRTVGSRKARDLAPTGVATTADADV